MAFIDWLFGRDEVRLPAPDPVAVDERPGVVYAPAPGRAMPISEVPDPVFSNGAMGDGAGVSPRRGMVFAPVSGTLIAIGAPNHHALAISADSGLEVLVHVGIDTVEMRGEGFTTYAKKGAHVRAGEPLLRFDRDKIASAGHDDTVILAITNSALYAEVEHLATGEVEAGAPLMRLS